MKQFIIRTKDDKVLVTAEDRDHAYAKYFYDVINQKVSIDKIGGMIEVTEEGMNKPMCFRTAPLLWKMGIIGTKTAINHISKLTGATHKEAKQMLKEAAERDARIIPLIEELRLAEGDDEEEPSVPDGMRRTEGAT